MKGIQVIPVGSMVRIGRGGWSELIDAQVVAIQIAGAFSNAIAYRCVWWTDSTRNDQWIEGCEIHVSDETQRQSIEFSEGTE